MNIKPFEKKRGLLVFLVLFPALLITQFLGYENIWFTGILAGIAGGVSVVLFPDPDRKA